MTQFFDKVTERTEDGMKTAVRAKQLWPYLIAKANERKTVQYQELTDLMGYADNRLVGTILGRIAYYCTENNLPPLSIIAVNKEGIPGGGFSIVDAHDFDRSREEVFSYPWFKLFPPSTSQLEECFDRATQKA